MLEVSHVTALWMLSTESWTSAGRATEPITKQAVARRKGEIGAEKADVKSARLVRRVRECIVLCECEKECVVW